MKDVTYFLVTRQPNNKFLITAMYEGKQIYTIANADLDLLLGLIQSNIEDPKERIFLEAVARSNTRFLNFTSEG